MVVILLIFGQFFVDWIQCIFHILFEFSVSTNGLLSFSSFCHLICSTLFGFAFTFYTLHFSIQSLKLYLQKHLSKIHLSSVFFFVLPHFLRSVRCPAGVFSLRLRIIIDSTLLNCIIPSGWVEYTLLRLLYLSFYISPIRIFCVKFPH